MTNAIANPIIPNIFRKSKNSCASDFFIAGRIPVTVKLFTYSIIMLADRLLKKITINWIYHTRLPGKLHYFQSVKDYVHKSTTNHIPKLTGYPNIPKNYQSQL